MQQCYLVTSICEGSHSHAQRRHASEVRDLLASPFVLLGKGCQDDTLWCFLEKLHLKSMFT